MSLSDSGSTLGGRGPSGKRGLWRSGLNHGRCGPDGHVPAQANADTRALDLDLAQPVLTKELGEATELALVHGLSGPLDVRPGAGVDPENLALVDEQRHLHDGARLEGRRLGSSGCCVAAHPRV